MPDDGLSWHEREVLSALRRMMQAQQHLASLEEQAGPAPVEIADEDERRLEAIEAEIAKLRPKAEGRFGGGNARSRIAELETEQRMVLERVGFPSVEALRAAQEAAEGTPGVDSTVLEFARREAAAAEQAWIEIQALDMPPEEPAESEPSEDVPAPPIDLAVEPPAAS